MKATVVATGFVDFEITWQGDVFSGAPQASSAANFGTLGINFCARKAVNDAEWNAALQALACEVSSEEHPPGRQIAPDDKALLRHNQPITTASS